MYGSAFVVHITSGKSISRHSKVIYPRLLYFQVEQMDCVMHSVSAKDDEQVQTWLTLSHI